MTAAAPSAGDAPGFHRDAAAIGNILKNDPGGRAAVDAAAQQVLAAMAPGHRSEAFIGQSYITDRYVRPVKVPKDLQAKHGAGTRAAGKVATQNAKPRHR
jgi:hypothetical protein